MGGPSSSCSEVFCVMQVKSRIGKLSKKEGTSKAHHGTFDEDDVKQMKQRVKWEDYEPFHVIQMIYRYRLINIISSIHNSEAYN